MTETKETGSKKRPLRLNKPGRLELKKTVETGQVRQSFSHGRTKTVTVEVKRKRTYAPGAGGRMMEVTETAAEAAQEDERGRPSTLTASERQARARALESLSKTAGAPVAEPETEEAAPPAEPEPEPEAPETVEQDGAVAEASPEPGADDTTGRQDEEARRLADEAVRGGLRRPIESKVRPLKAPPKAPARPAEPETKDDEARNKRGRPDGRRPAIRRGEPRRRAGKLTVTQALESEDELERVRSLASVRRQREREKQRQLREERGAERSKFMRDVVIPESITVQELANRMAERGADVVKALMKMGVMATITQSIDADTAELLVQEFGHKPRRVSESDVEIGLEGTPDDPATMAARAPVVTVMGHVDHGKTSLLDALRETDVAAREAGGITQHIGAYQVRLSSGDRITFLDTPGHEAFTAMRQRGATVTDIVVLVVAADDGIQPQTVEAINHARAAEVPIIVAVNKVDRAESDPQRVRQELLQHEIVVEEMGGEVLAIDVSAKEKTNLDRLEEAILLQAELLELKASPDRPAQGTVVEAQLDRGRGPVATLLVQRGTLRTGDIFVAGGEWGRVRAMLDNRGEPIEEAGPSVPVEVLGLNGTPAAGDAFAVVENESRAREISEYRQRQTRQQMAAAGGTSSVEQMFSKIAAGAAREFPIVVKADVQGSLEAILGTVEKLATDEVSFRVLHAGVGGINESDVTLAKASAGLIIGFNVRANRQARDLAQQDSVEIRYYSVIYDIVDDMKALLSGMLSPTIRENFLGYAEIREVFSISKVGRVAGCMITQGQVKRGAGVRLLRDDVVVHEGKLSSLKRFKDEVKEVREGYECGMAFENFQDIKQGDVVECFEVEEIARQID